MRVLTINCGSSSARIAVHDVVGDDVTERARISCAKIGHKEARIKLRVIGSNKAENWDYKLETHHQAIHHLLYLLDSEHCLDYIEAVGHRFVHDGGLFDAPVVIGPAEHAGLENAARFAPLHMPASLEGVEAASVRLGKLPQIAVFDTHFHQDLPDLAQNTGLPRKLVSHPVRRYGFHGLSCEYVLNWFQSQGSVQLPSRLIVAHLGSGASATAILNGKSVDTTMGLTPLSGLPMATRAGDLDFGAALFVAENSNMTVSELRELLNEKAGLQGLSGMSGDMVELLECASESPLASHAIDYFCYHAAKQIAGLTVPLGGLDAIVFTGGIGAASQEIRERICRRLSHFGVDAPESRAENVEPRRPEEGKAQRIFVVSSDENAVIARHVNSTISASPCAGSD